tara:strand:+ start:795 stop:1037 length:243 start_codon:yes stop_codon:yes gene_type:complete
LVHATLLPVGVSTTYAQSGQSKFVPLNKATASTIRDCELIGNQSLQTNVLKQELELDLRVAKSVQQPASPEELCDIASDN